MFLLRVTITALMLGMVLTGGGGCESTGRPEGAASPTPAETSLEEVKAPVTPTDAASAAQTPEDLIPMRCRYQAGSSEVVRYTEARVYKSWVEMPGQEASQQSSRTENLELVMRREIETVDPDGGAVMKVTIDQAELIVDINVPRRKKIHRYSSTADKTETTWTDVPKLFGAVYRLKMAPDTTVAEIIDLDALRNKLQIKEDAEDMISELLTERIIKGIHQHDFIRALPDAARQGQTYQKDFQVPHGMIKATALQKKFVPGPVESSSAGRIVTVTGDAEVLHTLPKGVPPAPRPTVFGSVMIKTNSDMQEFHSRDKGRFDTAAGQVLTDESETYCMLALFEEAIMEKKKKDYGVMFTEIKITTQLEVVSP